MDFDMKLEEMTIQHLRALAKSNGVAVPITFKKIEIIEAIKKVNPNVKPALIYRDIEANKLVIETEPEPEAEISNVAIHVSGRVLVQGVGIFDPGYHIINKANLDKVLKSRRVRTASPKELAAHYGVK